MLFRLIIIVMLGVACGKPSTLEQRTHTELDEKAAAESGPSGNVERLPGTIDEKKPQSRPCAKPCQIDLLADPILVKTSQSSYLASTNQAISAPLNQRVILPGERPNAPGAYLIRQNQSTLNSAFYVKPPLPSEGYYARLVFPLSERLAESHSYYLNLQVSVRNYAGNGALNLPVKVIALGAGSPTINDEQTFAILAEVSIPLKPATVPGNLQDDGSFTAVSVPLGISHRRSDFALLIQVDGISLGTGALEIRKAVLDQGPAMTSLGLARSNLQWQADWPRQIEELGKFNQNFLANEWFRMEAFGNSPAELQQAKEIAQVAKTHGMKILLLVMPWDSDFPVGTARNHAGNQFKSTCGYNAGVYPISKIDPAKFIEKTKNYIRAIRDGGASVSGLIVMNEIDIICFNGDFPLGAGKVSAQSLASSFSKYAEILKQVYELRSKDPSLKLSETEIISSSLANVSDVFGGSYVDAVDMIQFLRNLNGVDYLKSFSTAQDLHLYPELWNSYNVDPTKNVRTLVWRVSQSLPKRSENYANPTVRLFMTEFGRPLYNVPATANEPQRWARFHTYMKWMNQLNSLYDVHVIGAMLYAYDSPMSQFSLRLFPAHPTDYSTGPEVHVLPQYLGKY